MFSFSILAQKGTPCRTPEPYPAETRSGMGHPTLPPICSPLGRSHALLCVFRNIGAIYCPPRAPDCSPCNTIHSFYLMSVQKARLDEHPSICAFFVETGPGF